MKQQIEYGQPGVQLRLESPIAQAVQIRTVQCVPCTYPAHANADDNYLRKAPSLFPDRLEPGPTTAWSLPPASGNPSGST